MIDFETALRATDILLGIAFVIASAEHLRSPSAFDRALFGVRLALSLALMAGVFSSWVSLGLCMTAVVQLHRFQGPYNGGADRMGILVLICLTLAHWLPDPRWRELAFGYLAVQLILSYVISGWVKVINLDWRSGVALKEVFDFSAYPVSEDLRALSKRPRLLLVASWAVIGFELMFPLSLVSPWTLVFMLIVTACFHLANAMVFGLNRFFWVWLAAYPSILWFQDRFIIG